MKIVVPLAGPDYIDEQGQLRALRKINGISILKDILESRPWISNKTKFDDVYFVLQDKTITRNLLKDTLQAWFPGCQAVFIPHITAGAALSALAAITLFADKEEPVCIDLADIKFDWNAEKPETILSSATCSGIIPVFKSNQSHYSYVVVNEKNDKNEIQASREKKVISDLASAGVYFFKTPKNFIEALHFVLQKPELKHNNLYYICPLANAFSDTTRKMHAVMVDNVEDFHRGL